MKLHLILLLSILFSSVHAQTNCTLSESKNGQIPAVEISDLKCIAKESGKKNTIFYTFGIWCEPCILHLPNAVSLSRKYNTEFYILLIDTETDDLTLRAISELTKADPTIKIAVLKDAVYGDKRRKRNKKFVNEITPKNLEAIDDYSKYIVLDNQGEVLYVTNWKDNEGNDWKDDSKMTARIIEPLLN